MRLPPTRADASRDVNTTQIWNDAVNADVVPLTFPVNDSAALQASMTVQLPDGFGTNIRGLHYAVVGLTFTNSPNDSLSATVNGTDLGFTEVPGLRLRAAST